ncbi:MAG: nucleoside phosphorylase [Bacteroidota bacterium]
MEAISHTDLILNSDGSIFHLHLKPGDIADTILLVGDPGRVRQVSNRFDSIEVVKENREFVTHTGRYKGMRMSVLSTGIGTDNIDIVLNELDALVNVDLTERRVKEGHSKLRLIRMGTSGALRSDIPVGSTILSKIACGFDGLYHFYKDEKGVSIEELTQSFIRHTGWKRRLSDPYFIESSEALFNLFESDEILSGITISTPGFYAPQVRSIRLSPFDKQLVEKAGSFEFDSLRINNFEMECSALYALSALLGHEAITMCVAIANRVDKTFLEDYKPYVDRLIGFVLDKLVADD